MAESITEGTLSSFEKQVGDFVEQDEEIATIETDKVRICSHITDPTGKESNARLT
jgi:2-oxoglutarate dehydrogenase E2 component (dihydrolipoamide succinyltransferase)